MPDLLEISRAVLVWARQAEAALEHTPNGTSAVALQAARAKLDELTNQLGWDAPEGDQQLWLGWDAAWNVHLAVEAGDLAQLRFAILLLDQAVGPAGPESADLQIPAPILKLSVREDAEKIRRALQTLVATSEKTSFSEGVLLREIGGMPDRRFQAALELLKADSVVLSKRGPDGGFWLA